MATPIPAGMSFDQFNAWLPGALTTPGTYGIGTQKPSQAWIDQLQQMYPTFLPKGAADPRLNAPSLLTQPGWQGDLADLENRTASGSLEGQATDPNTGLLNGPLLGQLESNRVSAMQGGIDVLSPIMLGGFLGALGVGAGAATAGGSGSAAGATDALTGVTLPADAVPIGAAAPSVATSAAGGMAALPALPASITGTAGGIMSSPWLTIGQVGASLLSGEEGAKAAKHATDAQSQAAADALAYQRESRDIALGLIQPEVDASHAALGSMLDMAGVARPASLGASQPFDVTKDPGYQFRLDQGMKALEDSAAAKGGLMSGGFARQALKYAQNYASNEYTNIYNRLASIANRSPASTPQANIALDFGSSAAGISQNTGEARASGYTAAGNSWQNALNQISLALGRSYGTPATGTP